jgi:hypothetical protein
VRRRRRPPLTEEEVGEKHLRRRKGERLMATNNLSSYLIATDPVSMIVVF